MKDDVDIITPCVKSKTDCSVGTSALDQPIVLDVKDLERGEQAEILGSEEDLGDLVRSDSPELLEMVEDDYITPAARDKHVEDDQSIKDAHQRDTSLDSVDDLLEGLSDEEIEKPPSIKTTVKPSLPSSTTPTWKPGSLLPSTSSTASLSPSERISLLMWLSCLNVRPTCGSEHCCRRRLRVDFQTDLSDIVIS